MFSILFLLGVVVLPTYAKSENANANADKAQGKDSAPGQQFSLDEEVDEEDPEELSKSELAKQKNTIRKLNRITERVNDPEIGEQIQEMAEEQEQIENDAEEALQNANKRSNLLKYVIGTDYKNLGELRKQVVHTRNNIRQLEKIQEKAGGEVQEDIDVAVLAMKQKAYSLQASVYEELSNFSLFGWLFRWMNGFELEAVVIDDPVDDVDVTGTITPTPDPNITVTVSPTITGEVTPGPTTVVTISPVVTVDPTITLDPAD